MNFLTNIEKLLDLSPIKKTQVIKELKSHYLDIEEELKGSGKSPDQIESEIEKRLGSPKDIAAKMNAVHNSASWKSALIAILPFFGLLTGVFRTYQAGASAVEVLIYSIFFLVLLVGSVRELVSGRRPVWLATWLAGAYYYEPIIYRSISIYFFNGYGLKPQSLVSSLFSIIIIMTYVYGASRVRKWRMSNLFIALSTCLYSFAQYHMASVMTGVIMQILGFVVYILGIILVVRFALAVFALHDYGSASQSLLFIFANIILGVPSINIINGKDPMVIYILLGLVAAISTAVIIYSKITEWKYKMLVVIISVFPVCFLKQIAGFYSDISLAFIYQSLNQAAFWSVVSILLFIVPLAIYEHLRQKKSRAVLDSMISV